MKDLFDFAILATLYFVFFYKKWRARGNDVLLVNTTMYIYLSFVLYFTLMPIIFALPFIFSHPYIPMNMTPSSTSPTATATSPAKSSSISS